MDISIPATTARNHFPATINQTRALRKRTQQKKREQIAQHYKLILLKTLNGLGAPECAFDYVAGIIAVIGYDQTERAELFDETFASATLGSTHRLTKEDHDTKLGREVARRRKQRQRILKWQEHKDNPLLFEFNNEFNPDTGKRRAEYDLFIIELVREIAADAEPGSRPKQIDATVATHCSGYLERFTGEAKRLIKKNKHSPESDAHRAATLLQTALANEGHKDNGDPATLFRNEFLALFPAKQYPYLYDFEKINSLETKALTATTSETTVPAVLEQIGHTLPRERRVTEKLNGEVMVSSLPELSPIEVCVSDLPSRPPITIGQSAEEFLAENFPTEPRPQPNRPSANLSSDWGERPATERQLELLRKGGVLYPPNITLSAASASIEELIQSGELTGWLSLQEIQSYDPRGGHGPGSEKRYSCPLCHGSRRMDIEHRSLAVNVSSGTYFCHRCQTAGKLREHCASASTSTFAPRQLPSPAPSYKHQAEPQGLTDKQRQRVERAPVVTATKGATYIERRGIPADFGAAANVRFGQWWKRNEETEQAEAFDAVIFPIHDQVGKLVAAQARSIEGDTKRTCGNKSEGVFLSNPNVLTAQRVAIVEAPLDALTLAAAGIPAIAICGLSWPAWLPDALAGREVIIGFDADEPGDSASAKLSDELSGRAVITRIRPVGGKDWSEIAERHSLDSVAEQVAFELGEYTDEMHDCALIGVSNDSH